MSKERPNNIEDWEAYVADLAGKDLRSQTADVNSQHFIEVLREEGADVKFAKQVVLCFVRQCKATGTYLPKNGMWDLSRLAALDELASLGPQMDEEEAEALAESWVAPMQDDLESFLLEAEYGYETD